MFTEIILKIDLIIIILLKKSLIFFFFKIKIKIFIFIFKTYFKLKIFKKLIKNNYINRIFIFKNIKTKN